jgi:large subunit ribosomal protein L25
LIVTAGDIPDHITIDVSDVEIGDSVTISSVNLPTGAKATIDRDFVIATISAPSGLKSAGSDDDDAAEDTAADAEGGEE